MTIKSDKTPPVEYWVKSCYIPTHTEVWVSYNYDDLYYTESQGSDPAGQPTP